MLFYPNGGFLFDRKMKIDKKKAQFMQKMFQVNKMQWKMLTVFQDNCTHCPVHINTYTHIYMGGEKEQKLRIFTRSLGSGTSL